MPKPKKTITLTFTPTPTKRYEWHVSDGKATRSFWCLEDALFVVRELAVTESKVLPIPRTAVSSTISTAIARILMQNLHVELDPDTCVELPDSQVLLARIDDHYEIIHKQTGSYDTTSN